MESKQDIILALFFNNPSREWHFKELVKESGMARSKAAAWLKTFIKQDIITKFKSRGSMPYYISKHDSIAYQAKKRLFAHNLLYESGFLEHLASLQDAQTAILFGSITRSDWHKDSDIDLFIYGDPKGLKLASYERILKHDIQVFAVHDKSELKKYGSGLLSNILKGDLIKGDIDFVKVEPNA